MGLAIKTPKVYNFEEIVLGLKTCGICNTKNVQTFRYSFAGRCCENCLPAAKEKFEKHGWND